MVWLGAVVVGAGTTLFLVNLVVQVAPRSVPLTAMLAALAIMAWGRATWRRLNERDRRRVGGTDGEPIIVIGAGDGGRQLIKSMHEDPTSQWKPVALLDDSPAKRHLRINGVPVVGTVDDVEKIADDTGAKTVVLAVPSAGAEFVRRASTLATDAGLRVKVLPGINDLLHGRIGIGDVRDIDVADVLGRHQIDTDIQSIAGYLTGQRVLVTGAGGSIGSELCRQIYKYGPAELMMLDRDESALHAVQLSIFGRAMLDSDDVVLADIRDRQAIDEIFATRRPTVVFHAAALKHLPMLEQYPAEAVKTNVWGSLNILESAREFGVERFVNISTDKAANPCSVLGYTKRIAEGLTATIAAESDGTYLSVRFGNVLGSRGSVLTAFAAQIAAGGPVTVTHPDITRYFMTVQEAVQLVIQAAAIGRDGEALVLDMGEPVKIEDVANQLIAMSGKQVEIQYTGLRDGEKMHEELFGAGEPDERPVHPLVSHVAVPSVNATTAHALNTGAFREAIVHDINHVCDAMAQMQEVGSTE
nr:nucleoside-diphosphate sugar epimerase/dehydratase [Antricoccus suffuscus]